MKPITPDEALTARTSSIPAEVYEVFNALIIKNLSIGTVAIVKQSEVMDALVAHGFEVAQIYDNGWLNVEREYRLAGWYVLYDKPAYNENYPATFTFSPNIVAKAAGLR